MSKYEELYAKLWSEQARREGHRPGLPGSKEKFAAHIPPSKMERAVVERMREAGKPMTTSALAPALGRDAKAVAEVVASLRMKGIVEPVGKTGNFRIWRLVG